VRRILISGLAAAVALATAGFALATLKSAGVSSATATFSAAKQRSETRTCTGDGDTYEITNGRYVGTIDFADPNSDLDGPVTIHARTVLNKTDGIGYVAGSFWVKDDDRRAHGSLWAVIDGNGNLDGAVQGRVNRRIALLIGSASAKFSADTGFSEGKLGNASVSLPAVLIGRPCKDTKPAGVAVRLSVKGEVTDISATSIAVSPRDGSAAQSCELKAGTSPSTEGVVKGTKVEIGCAVVDGKMTLLKLKKRHV
jgi:hypothetical protein